MKPFHARSGMGLPPSHLLPFWLCMADTWLKELNGRAAALQTTDGHYKSSMWLGSFLTKLSVSEGLHMLGPFHDV